uniref:Uncharacterized protein n=1 Tax=Cajanus cajan TaxID=3821 RepID=A0A151TUI3_CAJCA|nr:hypothetical protein KK1_009941 [Cajanus cajan]
MATYLLNILPHKLLNYHSPLRILYQKDPSYSHLRVFGCLYYPLIPSTAINKFQPRSTIVFFWGILRIIVGTNALIYHLKKSSLAVM